jgi:enoyl-CoA hydratase/carnithine racemase
MPLREELHRILEEAQSDQAVRAIVLTGAGGIFCSGGDISGMNVTDARRGSSGCGARTASSG